VLQLNSCVQLLKKKKKVKNFLFHSTKFSKIIFFFFNELTAPYAKRKKGGVTYPALLTEISREPQLLCTQEKLAHIFDTIVVNGADKFSSFVMREPVQINYPHLFEYCALARLSRPCNIVVKINFICKMSE
jgi:hypothetical protein